MSMLQITIFDLEYTAWECSMARSWLGPGEFREVVQIGAVKLDADSFAIKEEFEVLVRPRFNPLLSFYFENLTGISNEQVSARGVDFRTAYERFLDFAGEGPVAAFGRDEKVLEDNLRLFGIRNARPLPLFYDLRGWFALQGVDPRGRHSCEIGPQLGVPFGGRIHNALDDVKSLAAGMEAIAARSAWLKPAA
ncbi:MAG TPA: 3'-5' exonuclease [Rhizomicrobium sp.]|nr:3'-5' exonuclease [Rhizomicrobium sp.]